MTPRPERKGASLLDRLVVRAKAALLFERVWPAVLFVASIVALFFAASWLGLWLVLPPWGRIVGLLVFALAIGFGLVRAFSIRWPGRQEALSRLDRDSGLPHRPLSTSEDALANAGADPATRPLWDLHRKRLQAAIQRTNVAAPSPRVVDRDIYALRAGVLVLLAAAAFVAGPDREGRVSAAFVWRSDDAARLGTRIDAWIDPPGYTGKPPLVLFGQGATGEPDGGSISAPAGSAIIVRAAGQGVVEVTSDGGIKAAVAKPAADGQVPLKPAPAGAIEKRLTLAGDGSLTITQDGSPLKTFAVKAVADLPPRIALVGSPKPNYRGSLTLAYSLEDDYGVTAAEARFSNPVIQGVPVAGRTLVEPPKGPLTLPPMPRGLGEGKTALDLSDHPWAGARVTMTLTARDEGGNTGESKPVDIVLPARPFNNPLARALVEQRRNLVLDPDHRGRVTDALDALSIAPEAFDVPLGVALGLHTAQIRLASAKTDADLVGVADFLWAMALRIENGDLSKTEQDLRAAQKELRDAMERSAPPDEIKRLTENLRRQMDKMLSEMAQNQKNDQAQQQEPDRNQKTITDKELKSMIDRMEEAARKGDMAEAQRLLDQLNNLMNNLKTARRSNPQSQATREMNRSMNELNRMLKEQGDVRDKTFREGNGEDIDQQGDQPDGSDPQMGQNQGDDSDGAPGQQGRPSPRGGSGQDPSGLKGLQQRQRALSQQLQAMQKRMRDLGMKGEKGFSDAQDAMKQAEGSLGQGQGGVGDAVGAQGRALEGLQRGIKGLGQQMAQGSQKGSGQAQTEGEGEPSNDPGESFDPLGRPRQGRGAAQNNDLDVGGGLAARAARVMEELRRRLADPSRSQDEQDYLERLLKRY